MNELMDKIQTDLTLLESYAEILHDIIYYRADSSDEFNHLVPVVDIIKSKVKEVYDNIDELDVKFLVKVLKLRRDSGQDTL